MWHTIICKISEDWTYTTAPFQVRLMDCPTMSFLIGRLSQEQETTFRALMATGQDTSSPLAPQDLRPAKGANPKLGKPGTGKPTPKASDAKGPNPKPGKPGTRKPETFERCKRRRRQAQRAKGRSPLNRQNVPAGETGRGGPTRGHRPPGRTEAPTDTHGRQAGFPPHTPAGQFGRAAGRPGAPIEVIDSHLHLDRLSARVPQRGLNCIEAVTGCPPRIPVRVVGGVINYCDPEKLHQIHFPSEPQWKVL